MAIVKRAVILPLAVGFEKLILVLGGVRYLLAITYVGEHFLRNCFMSSILSHSLIHLTCASKALVAASAILLKQIIEFELSGLVLYIAVLTCLLLDTSINGLRLNTLAPHQSIFHH